MIYLTFNDPPSGIYYSQVTDVCKFIRDEFGIPVRLIAFISIRKFYSNKKKIRSAFPGAIVIPMFPGVRNWKKNWRLLSFKFRSVKTDQVIARGPFAAWLALELKKKGKIKTVCFDARGAYSAEFNEYDVSGNADLNAAIPELEETVLNYSDKQIAVSHALVEHWKTEFKFESSAVEVIPCTLALQYEKDLSFEMAEKKRKELGIEKDEIVLVYSGSNAGWQSLDLAYQYLEKLLSSNDKIKLLLLSPVKENIQPLKKFESRIIQKWVTPDEVPVFLSACDMGLLLREDSITNKVSSPVKFAEYLACGLKMIISENIGDFSDFVRRNQCGEIIKDEKVISLIRPDANEKLRIRELALNNFTKTCFKRSYELILSENKGS